MMRWLVLLLCVANIAYWFLNERQPEAVVTLPALADGAVNLRLLQEEPAQPLVPPPPPEPPKPQCLLVGSFEAEAQGLTLQQRLFSLDIASQVHKLRTVEASELWVYLPPFDTLVSAQRQVRRLQGRRFNASLITQGDLTMGVSLGIFSQQAEADEVMQRAREQGYSPMLRELSRSQRSYWLRVEPDSERLLDDAVLAELKKDFAGLETKKIPCEGLAQAETLQ